MKIRKYGQNKKKFVKKLKLIKNTINTKINFYIFNSYTLMPFSNGRVLIHIY